MSGAKNNEGLSALVETLLESQAMMASFFYIEMINRGLIERTEAAARLRALGALVADERQAHRDPACGLASKLNEYAAAIAVSDDVRSMSNQLTRRFKVVEGGKG